MDYRLPNGATLEIASGLATAKTMSAVANANPAVATLEALHGVVENDIIVVASGWSRLDGRVIKAGTVDTNDVNLGAFNSSDTDRFSPGGGIGSVREVTGWTQIPQVVGFDTSGGEQNFYTFQFLEDDDERQIPTSRSPVQATLEVADDTSGAWYAVVDAADEARTAVPLRLNLRDGSKIYYNAIVTLNRTPSVTVNQIMTLSVTLSLVAPITRYSA